MFKPFIYNEESVNEYFESRQDPSRILFVIMLGDIPVGELQLKHINNETKECVLSIHMQNNAVKGKGYGTEAVRKAVKYAFEMLGMTVVKADAVTNNVRSQQILQKVGFQFLKEDGNFRYYSIHR